MIKILLNYKVEFQINLDEQSGDMKFSSLHQAARHKNKLLYDYLVSRGADEDIKDLFGRTASQFFDVEPLKIIMQAKEEKNLIRLTCKVEFLPDADS